MKQSILSFKNQSRMLGSCLLLLLIAGEFQPAYAQDWTQVTIDTNTERTPYFIDTNVGFTFNAAIWLEANGFSDANLGLSPYYANMERTIDGGLTWSHITFFDKIKVAQLYFVSQQQGYASTQKGIYETTDLGNNWKKISPKALAFIGIYATPSEIFASTDYDSWDNDGNVPGGAIYYSRNDGATWDSITEVTGLTLNGTSRFQWIYGNRDSLVATIYLNQSETDDRNVTYLVYSTDLGGSWQSSLLDSIYPGTSLLLHISPHSCNIISQFDDSVVGIGNIIGFCESSPPYIEWDTSLITTTLPISPWIVGNSCAMYLCEGDKSANPPAPFLRSTNNGATWSSLDSGADYSMEFNNDYGDDWQHLSVVGYGAVVYAANYYRQLVKTTDGGDGTLSVSALAPRLEFGRGAFSTGNDTLVAGTCSQSSMVVYYQNLSCAITKLDSISLAGLDPSEYSLTSTNHNDCLSLPDTTLVSFATISPGTYPITVNAHFIDDEYNTIDTTLHFTLMVESAGESAQLHREAASAYVGQIDSLMLGVDLSSQINIDSLWPYITNIQATYTWDSSVVSYESYAPPTGWTISSLNHGKNATNFTIQNNSSSATQPLNLGKALFSPTTTQLSTTWVELPSLVIDIGNQSLSLCVTDNEDNHWAVKNLGTLSGVAPLAQRGDELSIYPNPAEDELFVQNPNEFSLSIEIYDAIGREVLSATGAPTATTTIATQSLQDGVYFFRATNGSGFSTSSKVVIVR